MYFFKNRRSIKDLSNMVNFYKCYYFGFLCLLMMMIIKLTESKLGNQLFPRVRLKNGLTIVGQTKKTFDDEKIYYSFRGIPFAEPPVGKLRFKAPVPLPRDFSNKTITAFNDGPSCITIYFFPSQSEDCLYLNVYTPQFPNEHSLLLPVMVWIYGGAFVAGDGSYATFGPDHFLNEENVIIVTFNYREGIFGFLSTGDEAAPGNYGLKDQVLALKWVQENIRSFGGNPEQVTVFGESSGAVSISYLTQAASTKGLFHRVILQSGTSLNPWALTRNTYVKALNVANFFGIDSTTNQTLVDGLRNIDCIYLLLFHNLDYLSNILLTSKSGLPYGPTMEPPSPEAILINKSHEQLQNGLFHKIPYIIGFNSLEAKSVINSANLQYIVGRMLDNLPSYLETFKTMFMYIWPLLNINVILPVTKLIILFFPEATVPVSLNINETKAFEVGSKIDSFYSDFGNARMYEFLSDDQFNRPVLEAARLYSQKAPVYLYRFSYEGSISVTKKKISGAGHGDELLYLWRWRRSYDKNDFPPADLLMQKRMIKLWTNFATTGHPTPGHDPLLENVNWEPTNINGSLTYLDIGKNLTPGVNYNQKPFKFWKNLFDEYGNPPYSTY